MTKVLLVLSSVCEGRIADKVLEQVKARFEGKDVELDVADFKATPLPLYDQPTPPSAEGYIPSDASAQAWTKQVAVADVVVILVAEYNYSYTAVLKNAIDWVYKEWTDKPVAFVGYGWSGGSKAIGELRSLLTGFIKAQPVEVEANLAFTKDIDLEGASISATAAEKIDAVVAAIVPAS